MGVGLSMTLKSYKTVAESVKNESQKLVGPILSFTELHEKKLVEIFIGHPILNRMNTIFSIVIINIHLVFKKLILIFFNTSSFFQLTM